MNVYKIVDFGLYCDKCKHYESDPAEDPCNECMHEPSRINSHKPVNFEPLDKYASTVPYMCANTISYKEE